MINSVVDLCEIGQGIVQLTMQDRVYKNGFSEELIGGLLMAFEEIKNNSGYKVVILTGYDSYFCSGGTREGMLSIQADKLKFTDLEIHSIALDCPLPVIAAMQGHGIGAGFTLGLSCDFAVLSKESFYSCNYMKYGFTPGMGASYIVPRKLGFSLAQELLFTADNYSGAELERRGIQFKVLPRKEVMEYACKLAGKIAEKPRTALMTLKENQVAQIRGELAEALKLELEMHEKTMYQPGVKERIANLFGM
ncbi:MAG: polyketide synthase [Clostridia bacterium]|nr:polyketide synthase [Clostridia bacterium]